MKSLRIIYYSPHPTHDIVSEVGYSTHQRETIQAFRNLGHEVHTVVMGGTDANSVLQHHDQLQTTSTAASGIERWIPLFIWNALKDIRLLRHDQRAGKALEAAILEFKPDLIYERGEYLQDSGVKMAARHGIPHYLEVNSPVVEEMAAFEGPDLLRFLGHIRERRKLKMTGRVMAISSAMADYLKKRYGCDKPMMVIPNCINPDKDVPTEAEVAELRSGIAPDKQIIGFVGSLFPYHGVDVLIRAFATAIQSNPRLHLLIVGDGGIRPSLESLAAGLLPADAYTFTGKVPHAQVMKYIGTFDIAVMATSNWYGSPIKIFEYGLMGRIIIAPDNGPVRDVMDPSTDGYLVQPDAGHLAAAIAHVLENFEAYSQKAAAFRQKIMQDHTWNHQVSRILSTPLPSVS